MIQLEYRPPERDERTPLAAIIGRFCGGMFFGMLLVVAVAREFAYIGCFPFYAVFPLATFSASLAIHAAFLRMARCERSSWFTVGAGAVSIGAEFFAAWFDGKVDVDISAEHMLWGTVLILPVVFGWFSVRIRDLEPGPPGRR